MATPVALKRAIEIMIKREQARASGNWTNSWKAYFEFSRYP
jgi:hypothetical protein